jgi:hypothetical protein
VSGPVDLNDPPLGAWYQSESNGFVVGATIRNPIIAFILLPFLVPLSVWTWVVFGAALWHFFGTQIVQGKFDLADSLLGILWGTLSLLLALLFSSMVMTIIFGKVVVRVCDAEGVVFTGFGSFGWRRRRFDPQQITTVRIELPFSDGRNFTTVVLDGPNKLRFGSMLTEARRDFVANVLCQELINDNNSRCSAG